MVKFVYEIVPHDGGWAYRAGGAYSETFATHDEALEAVRIVMAEQQLGDEPVTISYQNEEGKWVEEYSDGGDRPEVEVVDNYAANPAPSV